MFSKYLQKNYPPIIDLMNLNDNDNVDRGNQIQQQNINEFKLEQNNQNLSYNFFPFEDDPIILQHNQKLFSIPYDQIIDLQINTQNKSFKLNNNENQYIPAMISIITKDLEQCCKNNQLHEPGIDLICLIDKSGSMSFDDKIENVKNSLLQLLDFLNEKDRLCIIVFASHAQKLCSFKNVTKQNKKQFYDIITTIQADGGTDISSGLQLAFQQISQRKIKNEVTSIFLLSDGQDDNILYQLDQFSKLLNGMITIHTFGYGSDHDAELMAKIAKLGKGSFYYIQNINLLNSFFVDAFGRLSSIVADNLQIYIKCLPKRPFENIQISKTYGEMWQQIEKGTNYKISFSQIASDSRKDFVFLIELPKYNAQIQDQQRNLNILEVTLNFSDFQQKQYNKRSQLFIKLYNQNENIYDDEINEQVMREFLRVQTADAIEKARKQCEVNQNQEANQFLQQFKTQITMNKQFSNISQQTLLDLDQALNATEQLNFNQYGKKQMIQMAYNNYQQEGINAVFDCLGSQQQQLYQGLFQNKKQYEMIQKMQKSKQNEVIDLMND